MTASFAGDFYYVIEPARFGWRWRVYATAGPLHTPTIGRLVRSGRGLSKAHAIHRAIDFIRRPHDSWHRHP